MRKFIAVVVATFIFFTSFNIAKAEDNADWLDESNTSKGFVSVIYNSDIKVKFTILKDDTAYTYNLKSGKKDNFVLQMGSGKYTLYIFDPNDKTKAIKKKAINVNISDERDVYLNSIQSINWNKNNIAVLKAINLTKNKNSDTQKAKAIYNYIVGNMKYDYPLYNNIPAGYIPDVDNTIASKKGLCYDFASLYAAMLRSLNIPTKLVKGYSDYASSYHAWNEVYLNNKWVIVDTSVDIQFKELDVKYEFAKSSSKYRPVGFF